MARGSNHARRAADSHNQRSGHVEGEARLGPVMLAPGLDLTNLGVDSNVFNEPADQAQQDFTFTLVPKSDVWMKTGPTWISGNIREDLSGTRRSRPSARRTRPPWSTGSFR